MKWTPGKIAEFRKLAPTGCGSAAIAARLGTTAGAVAMKAKGLRVSIARTRNNPTMAPPFDVDGHIRARWATLLPALKEQLRADIGSM